MLKEVRKKKAYEDIVNQIRSLIERGKFKHGDQLPNEKELCETFKVSRSTVREAILTLETLNLVERRQGNGTYITSTSEEALIKPLATSIFTEKDNIIDIFSVRKILEPEIAKLAAEHASDKDIERLEKLIKKQERDLLEGKNPVKIDSEFHHILAKTSKNKVLERLLFTLVKMLGKTREEYLQSKERKEKSLSGHKDILTAIKNRNGAHACQAMKHHLEEVEKTIFKKKGVKNSH